jgi:para-nitrobenzyl esterase
MGMPRKATGGRLRARIAAGVMACGVMAAGALAGCATSAGPAPAGATAAAGGLVATTQSGAVRGKVAGGIREFLGIPYAAPPAGALRWHAPEPPAHWTGVRAATAFAPHCPQPASPFGRPGTSENCLFLNCSPGRAGAGPAARSWSGFTAVPWSPARATTMTRPRW